MMRIFRTLFSLFVFLSHTAIALESDRNQSVLVEADEVEMDFSSGTRIYRGNVSVRQGTIRILADQIELIYKGEQLDHGIATGNPAVFRQRPDGKDHDVIGVGRRIELDEINNIVTFINNARLRQGRDAIEGERIVYDMGRDRMIVRGGDAAPTRTTRAGEDANTALPKTDAERPRMVLQPDELNSGGSKAGNRTAGTTPGPVTTEQTHAYIGATGAPVFAAHSVAAASLGTLAAGTPVRLLRIQDGWAEINAPRGVRVWIYGKFVSANAGPATVTGSGVRLRSIPSTGSGSTVLGEVNKGRRVLVLSVKNDWKEIEAPADVRAWVPSARVQPSKDAERWEKDWHESAKKAADG
ncbi:MAG: lipopolysaccharide transport periplasmic protein LptA [Arenicellales bacterium]